MAKAQNISDIPRQPKGKQLTFALVAFIVLLAISLAAGSFFYFKSQSEEQGYDEDPIEQRTKPRYGGIAKAIFVPLEPFTVNLVSDEGAQFLQVVISLRVEDPVLQTAITGLMPQVRNNILRVLTAQRGADLQTIEGKDKLAERLKEEVNLIIAPTPLRGSSGPDNGPVRSVLFTTFIIQ